MIAEKVLQQKAVPDIEICVFAGSPLHVNYFTKMFKKRVKL